MRRRRSSCDNHTPPATITSSSSWKGLVLLSLALLLVPSVDANPKGSSKDALASLKSSSFSSFGNDLKDWVQARCGAGNKDNTDIIDKNVAIWVYEGALFDPLEGRRIANVEGLELVQCVASADGADRDSKQRKHSNNQYGDLEVGPILNNPNATYDHATTILSRKIFCYQSPDNPQQLLSSIRLRPNAPVRKIPTKQSVAVYDTATTFIARGRELIAHTEWPDHQSIWGIATRNSIVNSNNDDSEDERMSVKKNAQQSKSFDFTVYARQKSARKKAEQLFDITQPTPVDDPNSVPSHKNSSASVIASPRRAKLIEFGTGSSRGKDKFGARETYSYTYSSNGNSNNNRAAATSGILQRLGLGKKEEATNPTFSCKVRYSRYGEGPPFFGPGRICSLELQGRRVASLDEVPSLTASVIADRMSPLFLAPTTSKPKHKGGDGSDSPPSSSTASGIGWFRSRDQELHVRPADDEAADFWLPDYLKEQGKDAWNKIRARRFRK